MRNISFQRLPRGTYQTYRFFPQPRMRGLGAYMTFSFVWVTLLVILIATCLYTILLVGHLNFARSHGVPLEQVENYPWMAAVLLGILILLVTPMLGRIFGTLTTRAIVQRTQLLVAAASQITDGNYDQHVHVSGDDEIGQLEQQFNCMAQQLAENMALCQVATREESKLHPVVAARVLREMHQYEHTSLNGLTPREREILILIARGRSNHEIANELVISEPTVRTHTANILTKLHLADRTQAAIYALQHHLVPLTKALEKE